MEIAILIFVIINTVSNLALVLYFIRRKSHIIPKQLERQKREQQELLKKWLVARGDENDKL